MNKFTGKDGTPQQSLSIVQRVYHEAHCMQETNANIPNREH